MPPKPSFRVKLSSSRHENALVPLSTITFALPGTLVEEKLLRRLQIEWRSKIQKTRLSEWNLNISNQSSLPGPSSLLNINCVWNANPTDTNGYVGFGVYHRVGPWSCRQHSGWGRRESLDGSCSLLPIVTIFIFIVDFWLLNIIFHVSRTPPTFPESALRSPFSLSQVTKRIFL